MRPRSPFVCRLAAVRSNLRLSKLLRQFALPISLLEGSPTKSGTPFFGDLRSLADLPHWRECAMSSRAFRKQMCPASPQSSRAASMLIARPAILWRLFRPAPVTGPLWSPSQPNLRITLHPADLDGSTDRCLRTIANTIAMAVARDSHSILPASSSSLVPARELAASPRNSHLAKLLLKLPLFLPSAIASNDLRP